MPVVAEKLRDILYHLKILLVIVIGPILRAVDNDNLYEMYCCPASSACDMQSWSSVVDNVGRSVSTTTCDRRNFAAIFGVIK